MPSRPARLPIVVDDVWIGYRRTDVGIIRGRRREPRWGLRAVTLTVSAGECVGLIGANGAGKTTMLRTVAGVIKPTRGTVTTLGRVASLIDLTAGFNRELTGRQNLMLSGVLLGVPRNEIRERYPEIVDFSGLSDEWMDSPMRMYSAGMGLRLGFALIVNTAPEVLLVDEVLAVGDEAFRAKCDAKVAELQAKGCAVMLASHDMELIAKRCGRVAVLDAGEIIVEADPAEAIAEYHERGMHVMDSIDPAERRMFRGKGRRNLGF